MTLLPSVWPTAFYCCKDPPARDTRKSGSQRSDHNPCSPGFFDGAVEFVVGVKVTGDSESCKTVATLGTMVEKDRGIKRYVASEEPKRSDTKLGQPSAATPLVTLL